MGRVFRSDRPVPPASASPPLLRDLLWGHPRRALVSSLWSGFTFGFALGNQGPVTPTRPRNLLSAHSRRSAVTAAVALEVSRGHTAGLFRPPAAGSSIAPPSAPRRGPTAPCPWFWICPRLEEPRVIRAFPERRLRYGISPWMRPWPLCAAWGGTHLWRTRTSATPPPLPCAARGLAAPALHVGRAGIRRPPAPFWGPHFPLPFSSVRGGASLDCRTRSRVQPRPPLPRLFSGAGLPCCVRPRPASFPGPLPRPRCPPRVGEAGPADTLPPVPGRHPGLLSSGDAPPSGQTCMASRLPARVANAAEMHQAGAAVADRSASLRVQGGPSGPHFPPAAYRFIYDGPGLGAPHQPPRGGPRGHRVVGGIPAQLEWAGFLPAAARRRGGTRVCYRRGRGRAWRGVRSEMALRGVARRLPRLSCQCPGVVCRGGRRVLPTGTCTCPHVSLVRRLFFFLAQWNVNLLLAHVPGCQDINADMLSRLQVQVVPVQSMRDTARADDRSVSRLGVALTLRRRLLANCVAASTSRVYGSGLNQCLTFCREVGIPHPFPLQEFVLELFVALRGTRLSVATLRTYLAGLPHFSFRFGFPTVAGMHSLGFVLRSLQRSRADRFTRPPRRPITVTTLILLRAYIRRHFPARDAIMLLAAIFSAFFGLLRSAGYCSPYQRRFDPPLCPPAVQRSHSRPRTRGGDLRITASQTDPFRGGGGGGGVESVRLCRTGSVRCPFTALHQLLGTHPTFAGPLFAFRDGSYLPRARLGHILRAAFHSSCDLHTHSFRIGARPLRVPWASPRP